MDVNSSNSAQQLRDAVQITVLKKAMDISEQSALQLIDAIPPAPTANPPHLGNRVDTYA